MWGMSEYDCLGVARLDVKVLTEHNTSMIRTPEEAAYQQPISHISLCSGCMLAISTTGHAYKNGELYYMSDSNRRIRFPTPIFSK